MTPTVKGGRGAHVARILLLLLLLRLRTKRKARQPRAQSQTTSWMGHLGQGAQPSQHGSSGLCGWPEDRGHPLWEVSTRPKTRPWSKATRIFPLLGPEEPSGGHTEATPASLGIRFTVTKGSTPEYSRERAEALPALTCSGRKADDENLFVGHLCEMKAKVGKNNYSVKNFTNVLQQVDYILRKSACWDFHGGAAAKTPCSQRRGDRHSNPGRETRSHVPQLRPSTAK